MDEFLLRSDATGAYSLLADGLGSMTAITDSAGTVSTEYTYEPFGTTTTTGASSPNELQFTGRENDGTALYYYRARYYHPTLQRFVSEDPIGFAGGDVNLYAYVGNSPLGFADPLGLDKSNGCGTQDIGKLTLLDPDFQPLIVPQLTIQGMLGGNERVSSRYYVTREVGTSPHHGIDIVKPGLKWGQTVYSPASAKIVRAPRGGLVLLVEDINIYLYHMERIQGPLPITVERGQALGTLAKIGPATAPNLHIEAWSECQKFNPSGVFFE